MNRILSILTTVTLALSSSSVLAQAQAQDSNKTKDADQAVEAKAKARDVDKATPKLAESLARPEVEPDFIDEDSDDDGLPETTVDTAPTAVQAGHEAAHTVQQGPGRIKVGDVTLEKEEAEQTEEKKAEKKKGGNR